MEKEEGEELEEGGEAEGGVAAGLLPFLVPALGRRLGGEEGREGACISLCGLSPAL